MKKIILFLFTLIAVNKLNAQTKDTFEIRSIPVMDMDGNVYYVVKRYDHKPTKQDSLEFEAQRSETLRKMFQLKKAEDSIANKAIKRKIIVLKKNK